MRESIDMASRQQLVTIVEARIRQHPTQHLVPVPWFDPGTLHCTWHCPNRR
jgi:hypothetical protein